MSLSIFVIRWGKTCFPLLNFKCRFYAFVFFLCCTLQSQAQKFYIGINPRPLSSYQYSLKYKNYPSGFSRQPAFSQAFPTNSGYHFGYQFDKYQLIELTYFMQDYADFAEFGSGASTTGKKATNLGFRYKNIIFSLPFFGFRHLTTTAPLRRIRLMAHLGGVFQLNQKLVSSWTGDYAFLNIPVNTEGYHTSKPQFLFQTGLDAEVPFFHKNLLLTASYTWYVGVGQKMLTTHYTGMFNGQPVDGYRYTSGGGTNLSIGLRWYLPKDTDTPKSPQLLNAKNFYLGLEYYKFVNNTQGSNPGTANQSAGLIAGYRKGQNIVETGLTPVPSLLFYQTAFPLAGVTSNERRLYLPIRYKRVVSIFKKSQFQNLEWLPSAGLGLHVPVNTSSATSFLLNGNFASDYQIVNNLVLGAELGSSLALNVGSFTLAYEARYLYGFSYTRQLQLFDNNSQPTDYYISSTPTGWMLGVSVRYRFGN